MKITRVRAWPVNIPLCRPYYWSVGTYPGTSKTIIEVETDEGITGIGEAPSHDCAELIASDLAPRLLERDPLDIAKCEAVCVPEWRVVQNTDDARVVKSFGGIELALWDIRGKTWNQPLYQLLGGAVRKEIPFTEYFAFRPADGSHPAETSPAAVAAYCLAMKEEHGATMFEGKLTIGDPALERAAVKKLRETLGDDVLLRLDSNMAWSLPTAIQNMHQLEAYNVRNWEDPVATFEEMALLRRHGSIPFSTHVPDLRRAVALGAPDNIVTNFAVLGGINRAIRFVGACEAMGIGFWCYSGDAGICTAAYLHFVAATPWITEPSQSLFRWQSEDVIEDGPFRQKNNVIEVPEGPGLGVVLSRKRLELCHRHFIDHGPMDHFCNGRASSEYRRLPLA